MSFQGVVADGMIVLEGGGQLPNGTRVEILVAPESVPAESESSLASLLQFAGEVKDVPSDTARIHDHYLHGAPKK